MNGDFEEPGRIIPNRSGNRRQEYTEVCARELSGAMQLNTLVDGQNLALNISSEMVKIKVSSWETSLCQLEDFVHQLHCQDDFWEY